MDLVEETEERFAPRHKTQDKKILLFLGRLHPKKGLVNALRAWHSLLKTENLKLTNSSWTFAIAGWDQGGHEAELKRLCDRAELEKRMTMKSTGLIGCGLKPLPMSAVKCASSVTIQSACAVMAQSANLSSS